MVSKCCLFTPVITRPARTPIINHRRCQCPKWIQGTLPDGRSIRTSAQTRNWDKAEVKMRAIEDAADPHKPAIKSRVTIDDAIQSFRDDEKSRHLSKDSQRKSEIFRKAVEVVGQGPGFRVPGSVDFADAHAIPCSFRTEASAPTWIALRAC